MGGGMHFGAMGGGMRFGGSRFAVRILCMQDSRLGFRGSVSETIGFSAMIASIDLRS
jgi:hypothetical protein